MDEPWEGSAPPDIWEEENSAPIEGFDEWDLFGSPTFPDFVPVDKSHEPARARQPKPKPQPSPPSPIQDALREVAAKSSERDHRVRAENTPENLIAKAIDYGASAEALQSLAKSLQPTTVTYNPLEDNPKTESGREFFGTVAKRAGLSVSETEEAFPWIQENLGTVGSVSVEDVVTYAEARHGKPFEVVDPTSPSGVELKEVTQTRWQHVHSGTARAQALSEGRPAVGKLPVPGSIGMEPVEDPILGEEYRLGSMTLPIEHTALIPGPEIHEKDEGGILAHGSKKAIKIPKRAKNQVFGNKGFFGNQEQFPVQPASIAGQFGREKQTGQVVPTRVIMNPGAILPEGQFVISPELGGFERPLMKMVPLPDSAHDLSADEILESLNIREGESYPLDDEYFDVGPGMRQQVRQFDEFDIEHIGFDVKIYGKPGREHKQRSLVLQGTGKRKARKSMNIKQGTKGGAAVSPEFFRAEREAGLDPTFAAMSIVEPVQLMGLWASAMPEEELAELLEVEELPEKWQPGFTKKLLKKAPDLFETNEIELYQNLDDPRVQAAVEAGSAEILGEEMRGDARFGRVKHQMVSARMDLHLQPQQMYEYHTRSSSQEWMEMLEQKNPVLASMYREGEWERKDARAQIAGAAAASEGKAPYFAAVKAEDLDWDEARQWAELNPKNPNAIVENLAFMQGITDAGIRIDVDAEDVDRKALVGVPEEKLKKISKEEYETRKSQSLVLPSPYHMRQMFGQEDVEGINWSRLFKSYRGVLNAYAGVFSEKQQREGENSRRDVLQRSITSYTEELRKVVDTPSFKHNLTSTQTPTVGGDILAHGALAPGEIFLSAEKNQEMIEQLWNRKAFVSPDVKRQYETPEAFAEAVWLGKVESPEYLFERPPSTISAEWGTYVRQVSANEMAERLDLTFEEVASLGSFNSPVASPSQGGDEDNDPKLIKPAMRFEVEGGKVVSRGLSGMTAREMDRNMIESALAHPAGETLGTIEDIGDQAALLSGDRRDIAKALYKPLAATPLNEVTKNSLRFEERKSMMGPSYNMFLRRLNATMLAGEPSEAKTEAAFTIRDKLGGPLYMAGQDAEKYPESAKELMDFLNSYDADTQSWLEKEQVGADDYGRPIEKSRPRSVNTRTGDIIDIGLGHTLAMINDPDLDFGVREGALLWSPAEDEAAVERMTAALEKASENPKRWKEYLRREYIESAGYKPGTTGEGQDPRREEYGASYISPQLREIRTDLPRVEKDVLQGLVERSPLLTLVQGMGTENAERNFEFKQEQREKHGKRVYEASLLSREYKDPAIAARVQRQHDIGKSLVDMTKIVSRHGDPFDKLKTQTEFVGFLEGMSESGMGSHIRRREQDVLMRHLGSAPSDYRLRKAFEGQPTSGGSPAMTMLEIESGEFHPVPRDPDDEARGRGEMALWEEAFWDMPFVAGSDVLPDITEFAGVPVKVRNDIVSRSGGRRIHAHARAGSDPLIELDPDLAIDAFRRGAYNNPAVKGVQPVGDFIRNEQDSLKFTLAHEWAHTQGVVGKGAASENRANAIGLLAIGVDPADVSGRYGLESLPEDVLGLGEKVGGLFAGETISPSEKPPMDFGLPPEEPPMDFGAPPEEPPMDFGPPPMDDYESMMAEEVPLDDFYAAQGRDAIQASDLLQSQKMRPSGEAEMRQSFTQNIWPLIQGNDEQRSIIERFSQGHLAVEANPGSGKSFVGTGWAFRQLQAGRSGVTMLAFNRSAASSLRSDLRENLGDYAAKNVDVRTFDSFSSSLLRKIPGFDKTKILMGDKPVRTATGERDPGALIEHTMGAIGEVGAEDLSVLERSGLLRSHSRKSESKRESVARAAVEYSENLMRDQGAFATEMQLEGGGKAQQILHSLASKAQASRLSGDVFEGTRGKVGGVTLSEAKNLSARAIEANPQLASGLDAIFVDEAQDLDQSDVRLVRALGNAGSEITAVGDRNQAIYEQLKGSVGDFAEAMDIPEVMGMTKNFRSGQGVLDFINEQFQYPESQALQAGTDREGKVETQWVPSQPGLEDWQAEQRMAAGRVKQLVSQGAEPGDIMMAHQTHEQREYFNSLLDKMGIEHTSVVNRDELSERLIRTRAEEAGVPVEDAISGIRSRLESDSSYRAGFESDLDDLVRGAEGGGVRSQIGLTLKGAKSKHMISTGAAVRPGFGTRGSVVSEQEAALAEDVGVYSAMQSGEGTGWRQLMVNASRGQESVFIAGAGGRPLPGLSADQSPAKAGVDALAELPETVKRVQKRFDDFGKVIQTTSKEMDALSKATKSMAPEEAAFAKQALGRELGGAMRQMQETAFSEGGVKGLQALYASEQWRAAKTKAGEMQGGGRRRYTNLFAARSMWQQFGGSVFQQMIPAAAQERKAAWTASLAAGGYYEGQSGLVSDMAAAATRQREAVSDAGEVGYRAWGWAQGSGITDAATKSMGVLGPGIGVGMGLHFLGASPQLAIAAGVGTAAVGGYNYLKSLGEETSENQLRISQDFEKIQSGEAKQDRNFLGRLGSKVFGEKWYSKMEAGYRGIGYKLSGRGISEESLGSDIIRGNELRSTQLGDLEGKDRASVLSYYAGELVDREGSAFSQLGTQGTLQLLGQYAAYEDFSGMTSRDLMKDESLVKRLERQAVTGRTLEMYRGLTGGQASTEELRMLEGRWSDMNAYEFREASGTLGKLQGLRRFGLDQEQLASYAEHGEISFEQNQDIQRLIGGGRRVWSKLGRELGVAELQTTDQLGFQIGSNWGGGLLQTALTGVQGVQFSGPGQVQIAGQSVGFNQWAMQDFQRQQMQANQEFQMGQQWQQFNLSGAYMMGTGQFAGRGQWDFQDRQRDMSRQYRADQWAMQDRQDEMSDRWWEIGTAHSAEKFAWNYQRGLADMARQEARSGVQFEWQEEGLARQGARSALEFGWQMEDLEENLKFATGRQRRQLLREQERGAIRYGMGQEDLESQEEQLETRRGWAEEDQALARENFEKQMEWQREEQEMSRAQHEESVALREERQQMERDFAQESDTLQDERTEAERDYYKMTREMQEESLEQQQKMLELNRDLQNAQIELARTTETWTRNFQAKFEDGSALDSEVDAFIGRVITGFQEAENEIERNRIGGR